MQVSRRAAIAAFVFVVAGAVAGVASSSSSRVSVASWYGPGLYGNRLACGGRLSPSTNGVAHKSLPCGTRLVVCFRGRCRRTVVVDRGPFVAGRELDLTAGLAASLRFAGVGVVHWYVAG